MKVRQSHLFKLHLVDKFASLIYPYEVRERILVHISDIQGCIIEMLTVESSAIDASLHDRVVTLYYWSEERGLCDVVDLWLIRKEPGRSLAFLRFSLLALASPGAIRGGNLATLVNGLAVRAVHKELLRALLLFTGSTDFDFALRLPGSLGC